MLKYKTLKYFVQFIIIAFLAIYIGVVGLLRVPYIQRQVSQLVEQSLSKELKTKVRIEQIDLGLLNRVIVRNICISDLEGQEMLKASRVSAKLSISDLLQGKIYINNAQLFGLKATLKKATPSSPANFAFILDALKSDKKESETPLDLRINTLLIRRGQVTYDIVSETETPQRINLNHLNISNLSATIALKAFTQDSLHLQIKRMSLQEKSGLDIRKLAFKVQANKEALQVEDLELSLPQSKLQIPSFQAQYTYDTDIQKWLNSADFGGGIEASIHFPDLQGLFPIPQNTDTRIKFSCNVECKKRKLYIRDLNVNDIHQEGRLQAEALIDYGNPAGLYFFGKVNDCYLSQKGIIDIAIVLSAPTDSLSPIHHLQQIHFSGDISGFPDRFTTQGYLQTGIGDLRTNFTLQKDSIKNETIYSGTFYSDGLHIGKLLQKEALGEVAISIEVKDLKYKDKLIETYVKGDIAKLEYNKHTYENIHLNGWYKDDGFTGDFSLEDPNGNLSLQSKMEKRKGVPYYQFTADLKDFSPYQLQLTDQYKDYLFSGHLYADFSGKSIDEFVGEVRLDSISMLHPEAEKTLYIPQIHLSSTIENGRKKMTIQSPFIEGEISGAYHYNSILKCIENGVKPYLPTLVADNILRPNKQAEELQFFLQIKNTDVFKTLFHIPIDIAEKATIEGRFSEENNLFHLSADIPKFKYKNTKYENTIISCSNTKESLYTKIATKIRLKRDDFLQLSLNGSAQNDSLFTELIWENKACTYSGQVESTTSFSRQSPSKQLQAHIALHPSTIVLNNADWNIHPSSVFLTANHYQFNKFLIDHEDQHLQIDGIIGKEKEDNCHISINKLDLSYILNMVQFDAVSFNGLVSGKINVNQALATPILQTQLFVKNFYFNGGEMGDTDITAHWDKEIKGINLLAKMHKDGEKITEVTGYVSPPTERLDLHIKAEKTNLAFMESFVGNLFSDIKGTGKGYVRLYGPFSSLDLEGKINAKANVLVNILQTRFDAESSDIVFQSGQMNFHNVKLTDGRQHTGTAEGSVKHNKLHDMKYDFKFTSDNMLVYNTKEATKDFPFFGKIYATGDLRLQGEGGELHINGNVRSEKDTEFTYLLGGITQAISNKFISFVDKTPQKEAPTVQKDEYNNIIPVAQVDNAKAESSDNIYINLQIDTTPDAYIKVIMNPIAGDYIGCRGRGALRVDYYNKQEMKMYGNYEILNGLYKLSMQNIIRKDFSLQSGGTVSFNGDPLSGNLNVKAVHTVSSASLSDLIATSNSRSRSIRVNCIASLTGIMNDPDIRFSLDLPGVNEEDKELVRSLTATEEQLNTQIIYLLGVGKFYATHNNPNYTQSNATSSLAFNTLSGQLNNLLNSAINNPNWNFGANLSTGNGWTDVEAEAVLSGSLLNNRLLLNGNFGYRENTLRNTNFVGDFEAIWLLTRNGDIRIKGYNKTNDRYFTKSTLTTQGIGLMYQKDFTNWKSLFQWFPRRNKKTKNTNKK